jgi:hypothetical protein
MAFQRAPLWSPRAKGYRIRKDTNVLQVISRPNPDGYDTLHVGVGKCIFDQSLNHAYFIGHAAKIGGLVLDYGCAATDD